MDILSYLTIAMKLVPILLEAGKDISAFAQTTLAVIQRGGDPTAQEWADLDAMEANLRAELQAPLADE